MSQLQFIEVGLSRLQADLRQARLAALATPGRPRPDEPGHAAERAQLQTFAIRHQLLLATGLRVLRQRESLLALRQQNLASLPRERRYGEQQSIDDSLKRLERVRVLADEAARLLWMLQARLESPPSEVDLLNGLRDITDLMAERQDLLQALHRHLQQPQDGPAWMAPPPPKLADAAAVVPLMLSVVLWLLRRAAGPARSAP
jgi:hypothetical protein